VTLPIKAIDRLFERLGATYGASWTRQWDVVPMNDVKSAWSHELAGFAGRLEAVAWALENLPERCPNAIEFRNLCRTAPAPQVPKLPEAKADPERLKAELAKLGQLRAKAVASTSVGHKAWARRIIGSFEAGERMNPTTVRFAREALRISAAPEGEA
jgi:hypothetical protein